MYAILRYSVVPKRKDCWGKRPGENDIDLADDIERIHQCRNLICHTDASGMETTLFNETVLDLTGVIFDDSQVTENINWILHNLVKTGITLNIAPG